MQAELAHVSRVTMLGELSASIAHEVNQPLAAIVINAEATQRYLEQTPPKLDDARRVTDRVIRSAERASNVIRRIRALSKKAAPEMMMVRAGTLDDSSGLKITASIWTKSARSWGHVEPSSKQFPAQPDAPPAK